MVLPVVLRRTVLVTAAVAALVVLWASSAPVGPLRDFRDDRTKSDIVSGADQREDFGHSAEGGRNIRREGDHRALLTTGGVPGEGLLLFEVPVNSDEDAIDEFGDRGAWQESEAGDGGRGSSSSGGRGGHHGRHWHKALQPLNSRDVMSFFLAALGLMIAAAGGIGGGGILVPIFMLVLKFSPKYAVPLSNITIFGGAITNTFLNMKKRHPRADRPMVDWDLILVMEPLTIGGALVGSFIQKVLPEVLLTTLMIILLVATADRTIRKGVKAFKKESIQRMNEQDLLPSAKVAPEKILEKSGDKLLAGAAETAASYGAADSGSSATSTFSPAELAPSLRGDDVESADGFTPSTTASTTTSPDISHDSSDASDSKEAALMQVLEEERHTPWGKVMIMTGVFLVLLSVNMLKGGGAFESPLGIKCGSFAFWATSVLSLVYLLAVSLRVRQYLIKRWRLQKELDYEYVEGDVEWNPVNTLRYPFYCCFAGFFAGMFGVGGGIVKGPLMLEMGVHPSVAAATSAVMILYTSFTATTSFFVFGLLKADYALPLFFLGLIATAAGQFGTDYLIKKFQRPSFIILSIGSVVALSAFLMGMNGVSDIMYAGSAEGAIEGAAAAGGGDSGGGICSAGV